MGRFLVIAAACFVLSGCSSFGSTGASDGLTSGVIPGVVQKGAGAQWVTFTPSTSGTIFLGLREGPDHNMWFLDPNGGATVRMSMGGAIKEFHGVLPGNSVSMTVGADNKFYVTNQTSTIYRVTTTGATASFPIPSGDLTKFGGLTLGPDGNVWFVEDDHIGKITTSGTITEFAYPTQPGSNVFGDITTGSDGNLWFSESAQNKIGKIVPSTGVIKMFSITPTCSPSAMVLAKDNNIWFACRSSPPQTGRITPSGNIKIYAIGGGPYGNDSAQFGARGPDGEPWFAVGDNSNSSIFRVNTATHTATSFSPPFGSLERAESVATGPDGNLWVGTAFTRNIYVLVFDPMTVTPTKLNFGSIGQTKTVTVSQNGVTSWNAKSSNTAVATVAHGGSNTTFKVTSVGSGTCKVTIDDGALNSVAVKVMVP